MSRCGANDVRQPILGGDHNVADSSCVGEEGKLHATLNIPQPLTWPSLSHQTSVWRLCVRILSNRLVYAASPNASLFKIGSASGAMVYSISRAITWRIARPLAPPLRTPRPPPPKLQHPTCSQLGNTRTDISHSILSDSYINTTWRVF